MPMFEFTCRQCGAEFEELCTTAQVEAGDVACPECGAKKAEKKLSVFASTGGDGGGHAGHGCGGGGGG